MNDATPPPPQQMFKMITAYWVSQAVGTFAELRYADELAAGPRTARELAIAGGTDADATFRMMRALSTVGVVRMEGDGESARFALTPVGETLRSEVPGSMRDMARAQTMPGHWLPWGRFREAIRTGTRQTGAALGAEIFGYYEHEAREREAFVGAMSGLSDLVGKEAARVYDASAHNTLCDVGGSAGAIAAAFLRVNPALTATVMDLPEVAPLATRALAEWGLAERARAVGGDFFVDVPAADLYVLKMILHDWNDAQCTTILAHIASRIAPGGRVLVLEMVIPDDNASSAAQLMDLNMLVMLPGRERTAKQYASLFAAAGLRFVEVRPTHSPMQVVIAEKA